MTLISRWSNTPIVKKLTTDAEGLIHLGRLQGIVNMNAISMGGNLVGMVIQGNWKIESPLNEIELPTMLSFREGESFNLPVPSGFTASDAYLTKQGNGPLSNHSHQMKIEGGRLIGKIDQVGNYQLELLLGQTTSSIYITVFEAKEKMDEVQN